MQGRTKVARRRWIGLSGIILADLFLINVALFMGVGLTRDFQFPGGLLTFGLHFALPVNGAALLLLWWRRLYRINARFLGVVDLINIGTVGLGLALALRFVTFLSNAPAPATNVWTAPVLVGFLSSGLLALCRVYQRLVAARAFVTARPSRRNQRRILIVGAGDLGESLLREIVRTESSDSQVVGFIDDDPRLHKTTIHGIPILGGLEHIRQICDEQNVAEIWIALPEASEEELRRVFHACIATKARVSTLPPLSRFVRGGSDVLNLMREVSVEELLKRASVTKEMAPVARYLSGERVLITGGGGSIGAELARQVSSLSPASLILLGKGENSIFEIDQELRHSNIFQPMPVVCDIRDRDALDRVFAAHRPTVIFHAAAHKHVPLMEPVPIEAVRNNVFGTLNLVEMAIKYGVQRCILVSTDKAVKPSNVMGATKRVAEMILSATASQSETSFAAVRFGNVLGSRGSLIPTLKKQILSGGPVTVTHPEMTRFFMTIPEAVQLIVQAGAMGEKGEIFILDMGDPVSIVELAKDMIRLHGLVPGQDIEIKFTGIRPGEKIHEELSHDAEDLLPCDHEKIHMVKNTSSVDPEWLRSQLAELDRLCVAGDEQAVRAFLMEFAWAKTAPPVPATAVVWEGDEAVAEIDSYQAD
ncbi:MAG: polysaccharide biosynthesis protein [Armatimonadetes bacterium]|nr:polysaccharide biosynthesis protein [Armatimonadota bacterium]